MAVSYILNNKNWDTNNLKAHNSLKSFVTNYMQALDECTKNDTEHNQHMVKYYDEMREIYRRQVNLYNSGADLEIIEVNIDL